MKNLENIKQETADAKKDSVRNSQDLEKRLLTAEAKLTMLLHETLKYHTPVKTKAIEEIKRQKALVDNPQIHEKFVFLDNVVKMEQDEQHKLQKEKNRKLK